MKKSPIHFEGTSPEKIREGINVASQFYDISYEEASRMTQDSINSSKKVIEYSMAHFKLAMRKEILDRPEPRKNQVFFELNNASINMIANLMHHHFYILMTSKKHFNDFEDQMKHTESLFVEMIQKTREQAARDIESERGQNNANP